MDSNYSKYFGMVSLQMWTTWIS